MRYRNWRDWEIPWTACYGSGTVSKHLNLEPSEHESKCQTSRQRLLFVGEGGQITKILQRIAVLHVLSRICLFFFICYGASAQQGPRQPHSIRFCTTHHKTHRHPVGPICTSDQLVAEAATYRTQNKHKRRTSVLSAGFEPAIQSERIQTYVVDSTTAGFGP